MAGLLTEQDCLATLPDAPEDVIRCLPALVALAADGRRLLALTEPRIAALFRPVAGVEPLPRLAELAPTRAVVTAAGCAEAVVLSGRLDDAWLARSAGIPQRWGYASLATGWFLNRRVRRPSGQRPASADFRELIEAMGVPWRGSIPRLTIGEEARQEARERLERARIEPEDGPLAGVYPGVRGGGSGRPWPRWRFEELVRQSRRRDPRRRFVLLATTEDLWTSVRVHEETGKIHPVIGPDLQIDALAAVLAELDLVIAADSWMLDLAAAAGTKTVGLYVRDPRRWAPPGEEHRFLREGKLKEISVDEVIDAAEM